MTVFGHAVSFGYCCFGFEVDGEDTASPKTPMQWHFGSSDLRKTLHGVGCRFLDRLAGIISDGRDLWQVIPSFLWHVTAMLPNSTSGDVDRLRQTGDTAKQATEIPDQFAPSLWLDRQSREDRRGVARR